MFELESKNQDEIIVSTKKASIVFNVTEGVINAGLEVGEITGPGEFEIAETTIRGIAAGEKTIYDVEIGGVHVGIIGNIEEGLDDLGISDVLCTSSIRAIREIEPKMVVAMGNVDKMVSELKLSARTEKKVKIKNIDSLPTTTEVVVLN